MTARLTALGPHWTAVAPDERSLVERSQDGDRDAFALLYRTYVDRIHRFAHRRTGSRAAAEDITAATFEKAWTALPSFAWRGRGFEPWLFRIAANQVVHHHRQQTRLSVVPDPAGAADARAAAGASRPPAESDPVEQVESAEDRRSVRAAIGELRPRYQEALSLRYFADLSTAEAAEAMGCSRSTFAVIVHRALRALEAVLQEDQ